MRVVVAWRRGCGMAERVWHGGEGVAWQRGCCMEERVWHGREGVA